MNIFQKCKFAVDGWATCDILLIPRYGGPGVSSGVFFLAQGEPRFVRFSKRVASVVESRRERSIFDSLVSGFKQHTRRGNPEWKSQRKLNCALFRHVSLQRNLIGQTRVKRIEESIRHAVYEKSDRAGATHGIGFQTLVERVLTCSPSKF